ncbi:MAG TPA: Flp pilus assembly protein CpaB [Dehalococcoidia bacterium]|nr:Flp pilus assembly protein CpaB [Dehalococcoidia bacterium]
MAVVLGLIGAILVYVAFSRNTGSGGGSGDQVPVVVAKSDIAARTKITASMVEVKLVNAADVSATAFSDTAAVIGQVTRFPIAANEQVLSTKLVPLTGTGSTVSKSLSYAIPPGKRAIAITVDEVTSAGGLILPGDYVDILVVYDIDFQSDPRDPSSREKASAYFIHTLFQDVEVLAVSTTVVDTVASNEATTGHRPRNSEANPNPEAITVTLALSPEDAQKLYLAEKNGYIRLSVRPYNDTEIRPIDPMIESDLFPRNLPNPFIR